MLNRITRFFIRISAFVRKEIVEVLRQPRLVLTLVVGPFLILLLFGIGYRNTPRTMRTLLVVPPSSQISDLVEEYSARISGQLEFMGIVSDEEDAKRQLRERAVDMVIVTPVDPFTDIRNSRQSFFEVFHYEIDPFESTYINVIERAYINELNRQVLVHAVDYSKSESQKIQTLIQDASSDVKLMREALEANDPAAAAAHGENLQQDINMLTIAAGSGLIAYSLFQSNATADPENLAQEFATGLETLQQNMDILSQIDPNQSSFAEEIAQLDQAEDTLNQLDENLTQLQEIDSNVLVQPFQGQTSSVALTPIGDTHYFVPAVISLLLQHISITLAALSIVGERRSGAIELFRAAPVSAFETMLGKYLSYLLFTIILGAVLTGLVVGILRVPLLGSLTEYALVLLLIILASLGIGFFISLISKSDSQAVQYAMIVLLASIFFTGFFLALYRLSIVVKPISWSLPATYGISLLQDIMLRGRPIQPLQLLALGGIALLLFIVDVFRLHQVMRAR